MRTDRIKESQWPQYLEEVLTTHERAMYADEINAWHTFLSQEVLRSWARESGPEDGQDWVPWEWRAFQYHHITTPLLNTGRLYNSFVRGGPENVDQFNGRQGMYGSSVPYAGLHQFGGEVSPSQRLHQRGTYKQLLHDTVEVPPRPMLGVRPDMVDVFVDSIADSLVDQMRG